MQHEVTKPQRLLNEQGNIAEPGFAKKFIWDYKRNDIKAKKWRIKEWDYFIITNQHYAVALTIADNGFVGALSASIIDYDNASEITKSAVCLFPLGKMKMAESTISGDNVWSIGKNNFSFKNDGKTRHLVCVYDKFGKNGEKLEVDIKLTDFPEESMVIATPFDKPKYFYYNQKINCMRASGSAKIGNKVYKFSPKDSVGTLDWGRGVWTYDNTWYWGSLQAILKDGSTFGWNIGYGFGNTSAASENMVFYNGKAHKLNDVKFNIPMKNGKEDYLAPWTFTSSDGRFEMDFVPIIDRYAPVNLGVMCMLPHQVFGKFSGKVILDDGQVIEIKDIIGFAEKVHNKW